MPELPDVQVFKEYLDATALHKRVRSVHVARAERLLRKVSRRAFAARLRGRSLAGTRRHGKFLFVALSGDGHLLLHFGMTGRLHYYKDKGGKAPEHTRLLLDFARGYRLAYRNMRGLGRIALVKDVDDYIRDQGLGPDALDLRLGAFRKVLKGRRGAIKSVLMNQSALAGIGNVYADEILFAAGVHPAARAGRLGRETQKSVHRALRGVLRKAIAARVENFPREFLVPHRSRGERCPRCGAKLRKTRIGGRATFYCPRHQQRRG